MEPGQEAALGSVVSLARLANAQVTSTEVPGFYAVDATTSELGGLYDYLADSPTVAHVETPRTIRVQATNPNDPSYVSGSLWGLNGSNGIKAPDAWDNTVGSTKVTIAVVDTGIDYNHPDLYKNIWVNQGEIPTANKTAIKADPTWDIDGDGLITLWDLNDARNQGAGKILDVNSDGKISGSDLLAASGSGGWANGVSDDGDTYKDDIVGWNFVSNTNNPFDDNRHGTHCAGTIGAVGNNSVGVVGVNWKTQMMALKILNASGSGSTSAGAAATIYAADHGARVTSNSWGGGGWSGSLSSAITHAESKGTIFVAAAGNAGSNNDTTPFYPANYSQSNVISVAATTSSGAKASFSNYGATTVDLGAPGSGILSTVPGGGYLSMSGTSMATPHVAGVFGLVFAQNPTFTVSQARTRVLSTVTPLGSLSGITVTGGLVNARGATIVGPEIQVLDGATNLVDGTSTVNMSTLTGVPQNKTFTVKNVGIANLSLGGTINLPPGFSLVSGFGSTNLAPGASTTFVVRLDAVSAGTYTGSVSFTNGDADENPFNFTLTGLVGNSLNADDGDTTYSESGAGWSQGSMAGGFQGDYRTHASGTGTNKATWDVGGLPSGTYRVYTTWVASANRATNAPYKVFDGATLEGSYAKNQEVAPDDKLADGHWWELLGEFTITNGSIKVELSDAANEYVIADAIRIEVATPASDPDLKWTANIDAPNSVAPGASFTISRDYTVADKVVGPDFTIRYVRSTNSTYGDADDVLLGTETINTAAGKSIGAHPGSSPSFSIATAGTYYLFARLDDGSAVTESNETNNVSNAEVIVVGAIPEPIDDGDPEFNMSGSWGDGSLAGAYEDDYLYRTAGAGANKASWTFGSLAAGTYEVYVTWKAHANRATNAPFAVFDGAVSEGSVALNQRNNPNDVFTDGVWWERIGTYTISNGSVKVELCDLANGIVIADAVRIVRV
jgi:subtilisin family serine protease